MSRRIPLLAGVGVALMLALASVIAAKRSAEDPLAGSARSTGLPATSTSTSTTASSSVGASHFQPRVQVEGEAEAEAETNPPPIVVQPTKITIHPRHAAIVEHLDGRFRDQPRSDPWAAAKEHEFRDFFATKPEAEVSRLLSADCRASICRLRIAHNEPGALPRFLEAVGMSPPFTVAGARFPDPDEDHSVMFLAREDTTLPWPDPATLPQPGAP